MFNDSSGNRQVPSLSSSQLYFGHGRNPTRHGPLCPQDWQKNDLGQNFSEM